MNESLVAFWSTTWYAWGSGVLDSVGSHFAEASAIELDQFVDKYGQGPNSTLNTFFSENQPLTGEFYIASVRSGIKLYLVMTSQRLWLLDKQKDQFIVYRLSDLSQLESTERWDSYSVLIKFKDGTEQRHEKIANIPTDKVLVLAIERCSSPEGWGIENLTKVKQDVAPDIAQSKEVQMHPDSIINMDCHSGLDSAMQQKCSKCEIFTNCNYMQSWELVEISDYKKKIQRFFGFPSPESHCIEGWKLKYLGKTEIILCEKCLNSIREILKQENKKGRKTMLFAIFIEIVLIALTIVGFIKEWEIFIMIFAVISFFGLLISLSFAWIFLPKATLDEEHVAAIKEITNYPIARAMIPFDSGLPPNKGSVYRVVPQKWERLWPRYQSNYHKTGWSWFRYVRRFFPFNAEVLSAKQGAALLKIEHLGIYLDQD